MAAISAAESQKSRSNFEVGLTSSADALRLITVSHKEVDTDKEPHHIEQVYGSKAVAKMTASLRHKGNKFEWVNSNKIYALKVLWI